jgi:Na+/H+ antiporter NhaC
MIVIIVMMALLAVVPSVIFKDGTLDKTEKRLNDLITLSMFVFFIIINTLIAGTALQYN